MLELVRILFTKKIITSDQSWVWGNGNDWFLLPVLAWPTASSHSIQSHERQRKKKGPLTWDAKPHPIYHASVPSLQVWGHKLAVRMDQGKTSCECSVLWYNHRPYLFPWRIFCTHIMVVIIVKISMDGQVETKSLLTLPVFNYPLIARHKPPCGRGKDRRFQ